MGKARFESNLGRNNKTLFMNIWTGMLWLGKGLDQFGPFMKLD